MSGGQERGVLRTLEFPALVERLRQLAGSAAGQRTVGGTAPRATLAEAREALAETRDARLALRVAGRQPWHDLPEIEESLAIARIEGAVLEAGPLQAVAGFVETIAEIGAALRQLDGAPRVSARAAELADAGELAHAIRRVLLPGGGVADDASPELRAVRRSLAARRASLETVMHELLAGAAAQQLLQERLLTTRNERYVLVVKAGQRAQLPGIVHGSSGSGASVFVEPMPAVELNNEIVSLSDREQREVRRILAELTRRLGERAVELERSRAAAAALDAAQARALLAEELAAVEPELVEQPLLELKRARHPLLIPELAERLGRPAPAGDGPVPIDLRLDSETPVLVISGPNTGGKTVALKTAGLLAAMAQSGLHVPADPGTRLPLLQRLFADIGDEQSIADSLSTFSGHLAAIVAMTRDLDSPALVLLDEVGAGTDPTEGGALAVAVVDWFRSRGALVIASTHHGQMKAWARSTPGVACASFGYDPRSWAPTYQLIDGVPGRSLALEMAERLGLPAELLRAARGLRDEAQAQAEELLRQLEAERAEALRERERLAVERSALEQRRRELELQAELEAAQRRAGAEALARQLELRAEQVAQESREAIAAAAQRVEQTRASQAAARRAQARTAQQVRRLHAELQEQLTGSSATAAAKAAELRPGDLVLVRGLGVRGRLLGVSGARAEVELRGKRLQVAAAELEPAGAAPPAAERPRAATPARPSKSEAQVPAEINVIGLSVAEALPRVDKLLDDAALAERPQVRVIHGMGRGRLKAAVGDLLQGHPHVAAWAEAAPQDGGRGVTVVELHS